MSRLLDLSQNAVLYGDVMLPQEAFYTSDSEEMRLVSRIFQTAKSIAELKLTETELALYQSLVLLWPGIFWIQNIIYIFNYIYLNLFSLLRTQWSAWKYGNTEAFQSEHECDSAGAGNESCAAQGRCHRAGHTAEQHTQFPVGKSKIL